MLRLQNNIVLFLFVLISVESVYADVKLADIPDSLRSQCKDPYGRLADIGENWDPTDVVSLNRPPNAVLLSACKTSQQVQIICGIGGYVTQYMKLTAMWNYKTKKWGKISKEMLNTSTKAVCNNEKVTNGSN